jgi:hypothetical protein
MPKFHKENMYYCLIMFNNEAYVASTQRSLCTTTTTNNNIHAIQSGLATSTSSSQRW